MKLGKPFIAKLIIGFIILIYVFMLLSRQIDYLMTPLVRCDPGFSGAVNGTATVPVECIIKDGGGHVFLATEQYSALGKTVVAVRHNVSVRSINDRYADIQFEFGIYGDQKLIIYSTKLLVDGIKIRIEKNE